MQLEKMTAQVRPRPAWEAVDLGFMMLQRWYRPVIFSWLVLTLPVFIVINYFFYDRPVLAAILFWWLLPIFDRIPLHILSRALFAEVVSTKSLLRDWSRILLPHLIKMLTIYRLDFARSYNMPVWQLEKLSGNARAERARVLKKMQYSNAIGLGLMCIFIEIIMFFSLFGLLMMFMPEFYSEQLFDALLNNDNIWWAGPLVNVFVYTTFLIVEPFYVAGGFSLYINRRTELEGWDIEIVFRQLAQRIKGAVEAIVLVLAAGFIVQAGLLFVPHTALADEMGQQNTSVQSAITNEDAKKTINDIMATDEFAHKKKVEGWYRKDKQEEEEKKKDDSSSWDLSFLNLGFLGNGIALIGQVLLWLVVAALVVAAVYFYLKWMPTGGSTSKRRINKDLPKSLFGLEITPESLPDDVGSTAMALWKQGKIIEALSLLYRGALTTLVHRDGINLRGSATEGDCIRIVARHGSKVSQPTRQFFQKLTRQWQFAAYAHRHPDEVVMTELCQSWSAHFGEQG